MACELIKEDETVATVSKCPRREVVWNNEEELGAYYFPQVALTHKCAFAHLRGTALLGILDDVKLVDDGDVVCSRLRYVHGISEAMVGKHHVTSVLLVDAPGSHDLGPSWFIRLPSIWKQFLSKK